MGRADLFDGGSETRLCTMLSLQVVLVLVHPRGYFPLLAREKQSMLMLRFQCFVDDVGLRLLHVRIVIRHCLSSDLHRASKRSFP